MLTENKRKKGIIVKIRENIFRFKPFNRKLEKKGILSQKKPIVLVYCG